MTYWKEHKTTPPCCRTMC